MLKRMTATTINAPCIPVLVVTVVPPFLEDVLVGSASILAAVRVAIYEPQLAQLVQV